MALEEGLSEVLSEFARTLVTDFPIQAILDRLVVRIVGVLPVTAAGVTLITPGAEPRYVAASDEFALRCEQIQAALGEGPCVAARNHDDAVSVPDLAADNRFPRFAAAALEAGLVAVFTFPLRRGEDRLGALDLYRDTAGPLTGDEIAAAQTLADVAATYLFNAASREALHNSLAAAEHTALHDTLTGLPSRALLIERLGHAIDLARRSGKLMAVLFLDLDPFKAVNDTYGHHVGDELLIAVAERLTGLLRPGDTLARLAGDEFVILCEALNEAGQAETVAGRVGAALVEPFALRSGDVRITASVGIAYAGPADDVPEGLLRDADTAMCQAKRRGGGGHALLDSDLDPWS